MSYLFVNTPEALRSLSEQLASATWITLDTEFMRERTYYPRLCLLQVASEELVACVDPLALDNLEPLLDVLYQPHITKVLHAARQDLEILYMLRGSLPPNLFDTQIAATVLGYGDQIGYGNLVKRVLGVELDKSHARTDWTLRPLDEAQLEYAADDVRYLRDVYKAMLGELQSLGRLDWIRADLEELESPSLYEVRPEEAWLRCKGHQKLKPRQLAVLRALAAWREENAKQRDLPRRRVVGDEVLVEVARHSPRDLGRLGRIRGLDGRLLQKEGEKLLALVKSALDSPSDSWPRVKVPPRPGDEQEPLVDALMAVLRYSATQHQVSVGLLAGRKELERLVMGERDLAVLSGWRLSVVGNLLLEFIAGGYSMVVENGRFELRPGSGREEDGERDAG